jgi:NitT/TauT family transport system permease protein
MRRIGRTSDLELEALDRLELPLAARRSRALRAWSTMWPPVVAIGLALAAWQLVVLVGVWKPWVLPGPATVIPRLADDLLNDNLLLAVSITLRRAAVGFALALLVGTLLGLAIVRSRVLRAGIASLITGLQTMPSIAWFPLAILLFGLNEAAIIFVVVLGAAPSVANGLIHGIDNVPRLLRRAGYVLGARGIAAYRFVILPAALPSFVGGMKHAWAFAWRSLMAGELLVIIAQRPSLGVRLQFARELSDAEGLLATMIVILVIGIAVDLLLFGMLERTIRRRWGLVEDGG